MSVPTMGRACLCLLIRVLRQNITDLMLHEYLSTSVIQTKRAAFTIKVMIYC